MCQESAVNEIEHLLSELLVQVFVVPVVRELEFYRLIIRAETDTDMTVAVISKHSGIVFLILAFHVRRVGRIVHRVLRTTVCEKGTIWSISGSFMPESVSSRQQHRINKLFGALERVISPRIFVWSVAIQGKCEWQIRSTESAIHFGRFFMRPTKEQ